MKIKTLLLGTLLVSNVFAFEVSELPNITARETPDISQNKIYSFYDSIKEAKKGVVNISTQKKIKAALPQWGKSPGKSSLKDGSPESVTAALNSGSPPAGTAKAPPTPG